jgi:signal transduction histidine kinase
MGLSLSLMLAIKMGGTLNLRSLPGKQTEFRMSIPCMLLAQKRAAAQ